MRALERFVHALEWIAVGLLILLSVISIGSFVVTLAHETRSAFLSSATVMSLLDELFVLFILIELFKMAFAYLRGERIVPVALETVIIAVTRKLVAIDYSDAEAEKKVAVLALVLFAAGFAWYLIRRAGNFEST